MITFLLIVGALGIALIVSGLPTAARVRLRDRVDPYLPGGAGPRKRLWPDATGGTGARAPGRFGIWDRQRAADRLAAAGLRTDPLGLRLDQVLWAAAGAVAAWVLLGAAAATRGQIQPVAIPLVTGMFVTVGWFGRDWTLGWRIRKRREHIGDELPTAIDLMALSLVAGESITSAIARVHGAIGSAIGAELGSVLADIRAGVATTTALQAMKRRIPTHEVARLVDALCAAIERGSPLADVLKAQAEDARAARRRRLLESGGRREVLMLVPVVFLILPTVVVFVLYPGLVSLDLLVP